MEDVGRDQSGHTCSGRPNGIGSRGLARQSRGNPLPEFRDLVMSTSDDRGYEPLHKEEGGSMHRPQYGHWMEIMELVGHPVSLEQWFISGPTQGSKPEFIEAR